MTDQTIVRHEVSEVQFGFYSEDEIRTLSVKEITATTVFDDLGNAIVGGLYDAALGPIDFNQICPTCHLTQKECPGHLGHIELPVPVYNPVLFMTMYNMLKRKCLSCHRFRLSAHKIQEYRVKILLLDTGYIDEAMTLRAKMLARNGDFDETQLQTKLRQEKVLSDLERMTLRGHKNGDENPYSVENERMKTISKFLGAMTSAKCGNCGAYSPVIRQDAHAKLYMKALGARAQRINVKSSRNVVSALETMEGTIDEDHVHDYDDDDSEDEDDDEGEAKAKFVPVMEVSSQLQLLWKKESGVMELFWGNRTRSYEVGATGKGWNKFFMHVVPVAPSRFRPPVMMQEKQFDHPQNTYLIKILQLSEQIVQTGAVAKDAVEGEAAGIDLSKKIYIWTQLQENVNLLMDNSTARRPQDMPQGIRQIIEKKEGLFRKHMMGKRVNYSARSVISPDPYIGTSEIGVPLRFALKLTYPQPVTPWNVVEMRTLVMNGPDVHPGANFVENETGMLIDLSKRNATQREAISKTLLSRSGSGAAANYNVKRVWRHLRSGDVVLMNRQPTLHKPSMMAHVARVLTNPELQTIRMHYVNCNTFNADFDGDEMNMHFPQNELARAEAYHIASNDNQYIVPTDGSPLRGLIQDHVDAGVKLCQRNTFLTKEMVMQLMFNAWTCMDHLGADRSHVEMVPPTLLKPTRLWTGKQVITCLLKQLTQGLPQLNLNSKTRLKENSFGKDNAEHIVIFRDGELLQGVLDKSQFGASEHGLVHSVYEIYGPRMAADLLTALGRLFTTYLQFSGHTCALEDLTLTEEAEARRTALVQESVTLGQQAYAEFTGESASDPKAIQMKMRKMVAADRQTGVDSNAQALDQAMMGCVHKSNSDIIKTCLPSGQTKPFPANCFSLMVLTGAKGSMVNHSQISCGLGQQALEGRRVPILVSGRSLPSFEPYDPSPRAGGYITDRFLTGLRPQEYYHHCMAGREGLVDTAVKTSRSGYLQRCLVKHLEDLSVSYDHSVRNSDGNVIQFLYGEDGIDPIDGSLLSGQKGQMTFLAMNHSAFSHKFSIHGQFFENTGLDMLEAFNYNRSLKKTVRASKSSKFKTGQAIEALVLLDSTKGWTRENITSEWQLARITNVHSGSHTLLDVEYEANGFVMKNVPLYLDVEGGKTKTDSDDMKCLSGRVYCIRKRVLDPIMHALPLNKHVGVISERLQGALLEYNESNPDNALSTGTKKSKKKDKNEEDAVGAETRVSPAAFELLLWVKYLRSLVQPGENVGTIAAQSIGEPSTQMTLNTFHLAGHGAANVTLGIPRLREIIMTASANMKTPAMTIPFLDHMNREKAREVELLLNRVELKDMISNEKGIAVKETLEPSVDQVLWIRKYQVQLQLFDQETIKKHFGISQSQIFRTVGQRFAPLLLRAVRNELKKSGISVQALAHTVEDINEEQPSKSRQEDEEDGEDQGTLTFGSRKEVAGYGEMDDEEIELHRKDNVKSKKKNIVMGSDSEDEEGSDDDKSSTSMDVDDDEENDTLAVAYGDKFSFFKGCKVNRKKGTVEITISFPASNKKLLLIPLIRNALTKAYVRECKGISKCFYVKQRLEPEGEEVPCLQTEGLNFGSIWALQDKLDINQLKTNDIYQILQTYGVEAARASISKQINEVFGVYGISVDARHLSLLSDYMTNGGGYTPLNRNGMKEKGSPFQQITFETSMGFLSSAATFGLKDKMESPSARLVLGQPTKVGTGHFSLLQPIRM